MYKQKKIFSGKRPGSNTHLSPVVQRAPAGLVYDKGVPFLSGNSDVAAHHRIQNTNVQYQTDILNNTNETVGVFMEANPIGPDHPQGSGPDLSVAANYIQQFNFRDKYIRGHLLNGDIGGPGLAENLFPITSQANSQHYQKIEKQVVSWVNEDKAYVYYKVLVKNRDDFNGKAELHCEAYRLDRYGNKTGTGVKATIKSDPGNSGGTNALVVSGNKNSAWIDSQLGDDHIEVQAGKVPVGYAPIDDSVMDKMFDDSLRYSPYMLITDLEHYLIEKCGISSKGAEEVMVYIQSGDDSVFRNQNKGTWNRWVKEINNHYPAI